MINLKKKALAICIVAGLSSVAVAQDSRHFNGYNEYTQQNSSDRTYRGDTTPHSHKDYQRGQREYRNYREFQARNMDYRNTEDGAYLVRLSIEKQGENTKNFQFRTNKANEFLVLNSEEITYKLDPERSNKRHYRENEMKYGKVQTGIAIRGTIAPSNRHGALQDINLKVVNNDLMGFGESCHGRRCINMPQEVLTQYDIKAQTYYNTPTRITEYVNANGKRVTIKMQVEPLQ